MESERVEEGTEFSWELHPRVVEVIRTLGYKKPTLIQRIAIPRILNSRRHILVIAPTGSGKTEAALFPALSKILSVGIEKGRTYILYITPLRALNRDLLNRVSRICEKLGLDVGVLHGDTPRSQRRKFKIEPPNMLITTPETLQFILIDNSFRRALRSLRYVIIDEAQEMPSSERGAELVVALERLREFAGSFQRIALSAAYSNPDVLAKYVFGYFRPYEVVDVVHNKKMLVYVVGGARTPKIMEGLSEHDLSLGIDVLVDVVSELLRFSRQILIFTNTRDTAEYLAVKLARLLNIKVGVHHGSLSREVREKVEKMFKEGDLRVLVATSSLELGIDIGGVDYVVQFGSPRQAIRLVQRVGRSGHREGGVSQGIVVVPRLITEALESAVIARRVMAWELEEEPVIEKPYDVLAHQIVGMALEYEGVHIEKVINVLKRATPFRNLTLDEFEKVLKFISDIGLVKLKDGAIYPTTRGRIYYYTTTMIVEGKQHVAHDIISGNKVGTLDEEFVVSLEEDDVVILGGRLWRVVSVDEEQRVVFVEPITSIEEARLPKWVGELIPVNYKVARETCSLFRRIVSRCDSAREFPVLYPLNEDAKRDIVQALCDDKRRGLCVPSDKELVIEIIERNKQSLVIVYACLGSRASEAFAYLLAEFIQRKYGVSPSFKSFPIAVVMELPLVFEPETFQELLQEIAHLDKEVIMELLFNAARKSPAFKWRLVGVARKLGVVSKDVSVRDVKRLFKAFLGTIIEEEALREMFTEKLELGPLLRLLGNVSSRRIKVVAYKTRHPSRIAQELLSFAGLIERFLQPAIPQRMLIELMKRRITSRRVRLVCLVCGSMFERSLNELEERPRCKKCGSQFLAPVRNDEDVRLLNKVMSIIKSKGRIEVKDLSDDEKRRFNELRKCADLVLSYGKKALIVLEGRGIGPETAKKILSRARNEEELYMLMYEAEKSFIRTRKYWR
ncbi:MAG: hypothetical protein DRO12_04495 [Thermoprotei archaeon]|nr:MAG: hypothetical protein DRO12_04495 [Thermoprotei archaeon]